MAPIERMLSLPIQGNRRAGGRHRRIIDRSISGPLCGGMRAPADGKLDGDIPPEAAATNSA